MSNYISPTWENNQGPKLNATNLQAMTDTVEDSQIYTGSGAPTGATKGTVGQKYVDESTSPKTVYVCTAAGNGTYTWEKEATREEMDRVTENAETATEYALAAFPRDTAAGAAASFPDGAEDIPVRDLTANIEPVQDLHGYDHPWPAGGGKNLIGKPGGYDGSGNYQPNARAICSEFIAVNEGNTFICSKKTVFNASWSHVYALLFDSNKEFISQSQIFSYAALAGSPYTIPSGASYVVFSVYVDNTDWDTGIYTFELQVERGSTITSYVPYSNICPISGWTGAEINRSGADTSDPETLSISWQTEAGTVYGGTLDVTTGVLTVDKTIVVTTWGDMEDTTTIGGVVRKMSRSGTSLTVDGEGISNICKYLGGSWSADIGTRWFHDTWNAFFYLPPDTPSDTVIEWVATLATPITYQLTPTEVTTLLGENNIWADCGPVETEYRADPNLYLDKRLNEMAANFAAVEPGTTASRNYAAGAYLVVGGVLYKASTAIASGEELVPGTNIAATTVGDELIALEN